LRRVAVVIPFKGREHKSRLSGIMDESSRRELAKIMLGGVIQVVGEAGLKRGCFVVSSDQQILEDAETAGATPVREDRDVGVNGAVRTALKAVRGFDSIMVLPSDLAALKPTDLERVLELSRIVSVVISPSASFTGTNLLLFRRSKQPTLSYDDDSFWHHLANAASMRLSLAVYTGTGVTFDLDTPEDLETLRRIKPENSASRFVRRKLAA
jgi:2-phospho-L-lactate guanylyltransferase